MDFSENTFKNYYYPENKDESSDEEGTAGFKVKQILAKKRSGNDIDSFFERPKKQSKILKRSSIVSKSSEDGVANLSSGQDDGAYASHFIKIEIYDAQKIKKIPPMEQWKHADIRLKYFALEDDAELQIT
ncbi:uncharacterized protein LOC125229816 [Leguminivora glycinivorella]|uniref:uncharacterized protein LOC125229816 n=1 Tax=Leguminivora glycinivorella TaxID=1035111 RepID=UPI00200DDBF5|nr:uncharacterized protein LOC125229816 [Leguminivora glycinivorella]